MYLTDCHKASIYTLDQSYIGDAHVSMITEASALLTFAEPISDLLRSEVLVTFYDNSQGLVSLYCLLSEYKEYIYEPGIWHSSVLCTFGHIISVIQRRKDIKVHVSLPAILYFDDSEGKSAELSATIENISAGGIFFSSSYVFPPGQLLHIRVAAIRSDILLAAEIIRVETPLPQAPDHTGSAHNGHSAQTHKGAKSSSTAPMYGYGCRFVQLPTHLESSIRNYVFQQDLKKKKP